MSDACLTVLIADDETPARNRLRELLSDIPHIKLVGEARNGKEALDLAQQCNPQVLLLDIRMPEMDGIEAAEHAQKLAMPPAIIFTTAFDGYAVKAFEMSAVDYLLKPIRQERLVTALGKARALLPAQLAALKPLQHRRSHFSINERGRVILVPVSDVIYLRAELKYITVKTREHEYLLEDSLISLEQELGDTFLRLHRNCLVAKDSILGYEKREIDGENGWHALLRDIPETIAVSRRQYHVLRELASR
ncbi:LytTR family DNA-binding domain-containing protein [Methylobacillus caricis]|uniref:LytR/AlgR family response regulator transcription factor n=1 Tax=Methylobacillus caricis TaxID=1971611 RepID=UPI001CFF8004|nr:LytTR family DNA-binding domain-containing protein [Methylobacillus caricis]MCB5189085.1 LytTR family DNA-binding domain-containing protein [Methylobacillus caricis]